jgi:prepilin-type N-terminal cleavage/methylation domain-containing protein
MLLQPSPHRNASGFTLVEAMVVVAIAGILVGFAYSGFSSVARRQRGQAAIKRTGWVLKQCQMKAIEKHLCCTVSVDNANDILMTFLEDPDDPPNLALDGNDTLLERVDFVEEYNNDIDIVAGNSFFFNFRGFPSFGAAEQMIQLDRRDNPAEDANVTISRFGRINLEIPDNWQY